MSDRVAVFRCDYTNNDWADWRLDDYKDLIHLAHASAWHMPYKVFAPDFETARRFVARLWRVAYMPLREMSGVFIVAPDGTRKEITEEQYKSLEFVASGRR